MRSYFFLGLIVFGLVSCKSIGTIELPKNRVGFSDAMITSEEQQLLLNIVRIHYEDRPYFVSVESITTSNSISMSASPSYSYSDSPSGSNSTNLDKVGGVLDLVSKSISWEMPETVFSEQSNEKPHENPRMFVRNGSKCGFARIFREA